MKRTFILMAVLLLGGAGAWAQNVNPTVVVTNTYAQEASGIDKPVQLLEVPDSVLKFNLDFDYSVQSTPYKGAYEFKPYLVQLRPMSRQANEGRLYLSGGMGYTARPELTVVWTPVRTQKFRLNVFGNHHSYVGQYRNLGIQDGVVKYDGTRYSGAGAYTDAGVNGVLGWTGGIFTADLRYRNIIGSDKVMNNVQHIVQFQGRVKSNEDAPLAYEVGTRMTNLTGLAHPNASYSTFSEFHSLTDASVGTHAGAHYFKLGVGVETVNQNGEYAVDLALIPRYILKLDRFKADLGVRLSYIFRSSGSSYGPKSDFVFPEARISFDLVPETLVLQAAATGGDRLNVYTDMLDQNPFLMSFLGQQQLSHSVERVNLMLGARGNIAERFYYNLKLGWSYWKDGLLYGFMANPSNAADAPKWLPSIAYAPQYHQFYVDLAAGWKSDKVDIDGQLLYRYTTIDEPLAFGPPALLGKLKAMYIWGGRIKAGVTLGGMTDRKTRMADTADADLVTLPGYVDLGLLGDLQMTEKLGLWLKVGNLLNQTVNSVPFHAEKGIWFTVGARLTL